MTITRRTILLGTVAAGLAGCATASPVTPAIVASDVTLIANGLAGALPQLTAAGIAVPGAATLAVNDIGAVALVIANADTIAMAQPLVLRVESDLNAFVGSVGNLPGLPAKVALVITAAQILLPIVEAAVNLVVPAKAGAAAMTPDQARSVLRAAAVPAVR